MTSIDLEKLTPEDKIKLQNSFIKWFFSTEEFINHFMKDDSENNFSVPTRNHMVV